MIKILFVVPYYEMQKLAEEVIDEYSCSDELQVDFLIATYTEVKSKISDVVYDVIIARGVTVNILRELKHPIPVIEIDYNSAEIINTLIKCREKFNSKKVAIIGAQGLAYTGKLISQISGVTIEIFTLDSSVSDVLELINLALQSGCDTIIGGQVSFAVSKEHNINTLRVDSDKETIWRAINEAVRTVFTQRQEKEKIEVLSAVVDNSKDGFILIDNAKKICVCNSFAAQMMGKTIEQYIGKDYEVLPRELHHRMEAAFNKRKAHGTEVFKINGRLYSVSITSIMIGHDNSSVLLSIIDTALIQNIEEKIRNTLYAKEMTTKYSFETMVYQSKKMHTTVDIAKKFTEVDSNVLIEGETGTGKEVFAQSIHAYSKRKNKPFVAINCAALPENLLESELFGYVGGAFTGASKDGNPGLFELAHNGTLFLDEISEIPLAFQGKLLRALQEQEIRRIGGSKVIPVNVRIIAATNRNLFTMTEQNLFRKDLYYRLDILSISIPPLRERIEDIHPLFRYFQDLYTKKFHKANYGISSAGIELLKKYPWPGNVRELQNIVERLIAFTNNEQIEPQHILQVFPRSLTQMTIKEDSDEEKEKEKILFTLKNTSNRDEAAQVLGISKSTLWRKLKKYNL